MMRGVKGFASLLMVIASTQATVAIASKNMFGSWEGILRCGVTDTYFSLNISDEAGQMKSQFHTHIDKSAPQFSDLQASMQGRVEPIGNSVSLRGTLIHTQKRLAQAPIVAHMALDESSGRLFGRLDSRLLQNCSFALAERKSAKGLKKAITTVAKFKPKKGNVKNACPKEVKQWLSQIGSLQASPRDSLGISLYLFRDENFKPYFGKTLYSLSASKASQLGYQVAYGCRDQAPELNKAMGLQSRLYSVLVNEGTYNRAEFWLNDQVAQSAQRWQSEVQKKVKGSMGFPAQDVDQLKQLLPHFGPLMMATREGLDAEFQALASRQLAQQKNAELEALMAQEPSWQNLALVAGFPIDHRVSISDRNAMQEKINTHLARHWQSAIDGYIAQHSSVESVLHHLRPLHAHPGFAHMSAHLPPGAEASINAQLNARLEELLAGFVREELGRYDQRLLSDNAGLAGLERWVLIEDQLRKTYRELLRRPEFHQFNDYRSSRFRQALTAGRSPLMARIGAVQSTTEMRELLETYVPETMIDAATRAPYLAEANKRLAVIAPFHAMPYADYFNAVYQADLKRVRELDEEYLASLRPLFQQTNQQTQILISALGAFIGAPEAADFLNSRLDHALDNMSLLPSVIAVYLFNYEERGTKACLRADAPQFVVTSSRPDVVTRNGLGVEISRTYGYTSRSYYRVNKEFEDVFRRIGTSSPESLGSWLVDGIFNNGNISRLHADTKRLMDSYPCDSAQMKTLEKNFIKLYGQLR